MSAENLPDPKVYPITLNQLQRQQIARQTLATICAEAMLAGKPVRFVSMDRRTKALVKVANGKVTY